MTARRSTTRPGSGSGPGRESALVDERDRERIRAELDETFVVEAAAGTGKTTELVQRIVGVLSSGRGKVHEIVAVTFTEKAAGELKLRLREALDRARSDALSRGPATPARRAATARNLEHALERLEEAHINTIHGFCADLLRERPVEAQVDPLFSVLTEPQAQQLFDEAFAGWIQQQLADPPEGIRRALRRSPRSFGGGWFGSAGADDEGPLDRLRLAAWRLVEWRDFPHEWARPRFDRHHKIRALTRSLHLLAELTEQRSYDQDNLYRDTAAARHVSAEIKLMEQVNQFDYDGWEARLVDLSRDRSLIRARKGSGARYGQGVARRDVLEARERFVEELDRFRDEVDADLASLLRHDLEGSINEYERLKARTGALDYLDLLLKARTLLQTNEGVRGRLQATFKAIFVDEFQDTDQVQAEILLLLAADDPAIADWRDVRPVPGKLFIVGDPKQSIYRFRRADVAVYRRACQVLETRGATRLQLTTSFRSRPAIQRCINAAFSRVMTDDPETLQAKYVKLSPYRQDDDEQPAVIALPVPQPYGQSRVTARAVERSLPHAVASLIEWLVRESGWRVAERPAPDSAMASDVPRTTSKSRAFDPGETERLVAIEPRHVCVLFRRFMSARQDITRPYVEALEARSVPHLLVGGKAFHDREEVETLRTALAAIEWPDDELAVFATLRGPLFAVGDEELLEYRSSFGRLHPFRIPRELTIETKAGRSLAAMALRLAPITDALALLRRLHSGRNHRPVADTIALLLDAVRAHVGFVLRSAGEQALANVFHVAELAREHAIGGGISFRGFVETLQAAAARAQAPEAPILEEGSDGVRLMTVHKAKGLEFPVVILADLTAKLRPYEAGRYVDPERKLCALRLAGWSPLDLLEHDGEESAREEAEGVRLAYVAATRARDLLVVPTLGDEAWEGGWLDPLNAAIYPEVDRRRIQVPAPGCPPFRSKDTVLERPGGDPADAHTVCPGMHEFGTSSPDLTSRGGYSVVWWDPHVLSLEAAASFGVRRDDLIVKDVPAAVTAAGLSRYNDWRRLRGDALVAGSRPSMRVRTVTDLVTSTVDLPLPIREDDHAVPAIEVVNLAPKDDRPAGRRFGTLVHAVLAAAPLDADDAAVEAIARLQGRVLSAPDQEIGAAARAAKAALWHRLFEAARAAAANGACRREVPVSFVDADSSLVEGTIDLAYLEDAGWVVCDFKTDRELDGAEEAYRRQVTAYAAFVAAATRRPTRGVLVRV